MRKTIIILTFCLAIQIKDIIPKNEEPTIPTISFNQTIPPAAISIENINNILEWDSVNNKENTIILNKLNTSTEIINGGDYNLTDNSSTRIQKQLIIISGLLNNTVNIVNIMNSSADKPLSTQAHNN
jgi:hypothetical protein